MAEVAANLHAFFGYRGNTLQFVTDDVLYSVCGNSICFWSSTLRERSFVWGQKFGLSCAAGHARTQSFAIAEKGIEPNILVYSYPTKKIRHTLKGGTDLEFADIAFSRDGKRLVSIGKATDYKVVVWDLEKGEKLPGAEAVLPAQCSSVLFNPRNADEFAVLGRDCIFYYYLERTYKSHVMRLRELPLSAEDRAKTHYTSLCWDPYNRLYAATDNGQLMLLNPQDGSVIHCLDTKSSISTLLVTQKHLIASHADHVLRWRLLDRPLNSNQRESDSEPTSPLAVVKELELPGSVVCSMVYNHDFSQLLIGTREGGIKMLPVSAETAEEDEEDIPSSTLDSAPTLDQPAKEQIVKLTQTPTELGSFHNGSVSGVVRLGETSQIASCGDDGAMRIYDFASNETLGSLSFDAHLTCITAHPSGGIVVLGSSHGLLRFVDVRSRTVPRLVTVLRVSEHPVTALQYSGNGDYIAVGSNKSKRLFFLHGNATEKFKVLGFVDLSAETTCLCWGPARSEFAVTVLAVVGMTTLMAIQAPVLDMNPSLSELTFQLAPRYNRKLDSEVISIGMGVNNDVLVGGKDKMLKRYRIPEEDGDPDPKKAPQSPLEELKGHQMAIQTILMSPDSKLIATGGEDGLLVLRNTSNLSRTREIKCHDPHQGGVSALCFSGSGQMLITAGMDGAIFAWNTVVRPPIYTAPQPRDFQFANMPDEMPEVEEEDDEEAILTWDQIIIEQIHAKEAEVHERSRNMMMEQIERLREQLQGIIEANAQAPEMERLGTDEFVVDFEERDRIIAEGQQAAEKLREEVKYENLARELIRERIKEQTWDKMLVPGKALKGLSVDVLVQNYPILAPHPLEEAKREKVRNLRRIELREINSRKEQADDPNKKEILNVSDFSSGREDWIINRRAGHESYSAFDSSANPAAAGATAAAGPNLDRSKSAMDNEGEDAEPHEEEDAKKKSKPSEVRSSTAGSDRDLIYEPFELYTAHRKRTQICLLHSLIRDRKLDFNRKFDELFEYKVAQMEGIHEKNHRISEILRELKWPQDYFMPVWHPLEKPEQVLTVNESEITVEKFLTREERERQEEERRKEAERLAALGRDDAAERALKQMMGGSLESKRDISTLEEELVREPWMDTLSAEEMTEEQRNMLKEFEAKGKTLQEEKEKYKKTLDAELKKLKADVADVCSKFDEKVQALFKAKLETDFGIYEQELYIIRLSLALLQEMDDLNRERALEKRLQTVTDKKAKTNGRLQEFKRLVMESEERLKQLHDSDRSMDKNFKREFPDLEAELVNNLYKLFKLRNRPRVQKANDSKDPSRNRVRNRRSSQGEADELAELHPLDPFAEAERDEAARNAVTVVPDSLDFENDAADGVDEYSFKKMVSLREEKLRSESEIRILTTTVTDMQRHLVHLEKEDAETQNEIQEILSEKNSIKQQQIRDRSNVELLVKIKQGQVEVPQSAVVTDYGDAILVKREVVEEKNAHILQLGKEKVGTLVKIKDFRRNINLMQWEHSMLQLQMHDLEERTKDVHMLRVTKNLQSLLRGGDENRQKVDVDLLERKIEHLEKSTAEKVEGLKKQYRKLKKEVRMRHDENDKLQSKIKELTMNVAQREHIWKLRSSGEQESEQTHNKRFNDVMNRRRLIDLAKRQTEEIEFLREELDRLRQKTFPSFAHLKEAQMSPDDAY
eukprot:GILJ01004600.1.p1 GENE.GILJ01004600.1~~GILJ01004600.1.p1  ORF type:complete len:1711 (-),score=393.32 GILJ01004600.1:88-5118(-)